MDFLDNVIPKVVDHLDRQSQASIYIDDPVLWAQERLGITLWSMQQDIAYSARDIKSTAVKACHGSGKSFLAAVLIDGGIDVHSIGEAFCFTTAPSSPPISAVIGRGLPGLLAPCHKPVQDKLIDLTQPSNR